MTYQSEETSPESGRPVELFTIVLGASTFRYTSAEDDVVINAITYTAVPLLRGAFATGPDERSNTIDITLPVSNEFVRKYINSVPGSRAFLQIVRTQRDDVAQEEEATFQGLVEAVSFNKNVTEAKVTVLPLIAAVSRPIPRYVYSSQCNHVLYDPTTCDADDTDPSFRLSANVTVVSGVTITIPGAAAFGDGWFDGGYVETTGGTDARMVISQVGDVFTLMLPFTDSPLGSTMVALAGCGRSIAICKSKFDNVINFGGFAFVPSKNIFTSGLN